MQTRAQRRASLSKRRTYRKRVKASPCRGKRSTICRVKRGCKLTRGKKRSYCRKSKNSRKK